MWQWNSAYIYITKSLKHSSDDSRTTMNVELHAVLSCEAVRTCWHEYSNYTHTHQEMIIKTTGNWKSDLGTRRQVHGPVSPWSWGLWCCVTRRCVGESGRAWAQPGVSGPWMKPDHWLEPQPPHTGRGRRTGQRWSQHQPVQLGVRERKIYRVGLLSWWNYTNMHECKLPVFKLKDKIKTVTELKMRVQPQSWTHSGNAPFT